MNKAPMNKIWGEKTRKKQRLFPSITAVCLSVRNATRTRELSVLPV